MPDELTNDSIYLRPVTMEQFQALEDFFNCPDEDEDCDSADSLADIVVESSWSFCLTCDKSTRKLVTYPDGVTRNEWCQTCGAVEATIKSAEGM